MRSMKVLGRANRANAALVAAAMAMTGQVPTTFAQAATLVPPPPANCTVVDITWPRGLILAALPTQTPVQTTNHNEMKAFKMPNPIPAGLAPGYAGLAFVNGTKHQLSLSINPCEWTEEMRSNGCGTLGPEPSIFFTSQDLPGFCKLTAGATYYFNVRNAETWNGPDTCAAADTCSFRLYY